MRDYLRRILPIAALFAAVSAIFLLFLAIYGLPWDAFAYAAVLCAALGLAAIAVDYLLYRRRLNALGSVLCRIPYSVDGLPEPHDGAERAYRELAERLFSECAALETEARRARDDMKDYCTLWAHQIKTPIAAMRLLLERSEPDGKMIEAELFRIEQYVEMVLQYLRLESDSTDYVFAEIDLDSLVRQALRKYSLLFILSKVKLSFEGAHCMVLTDEKWLCFALEQVISNALKYAPEGEVKIRLESGSVLVIEDNGIGIAPEDLPRVFDRGYTGYNGRTDKKSTGLGLYLCKRVLTSLGHGIAISSRVGEGCRVEIDLSGNRETGE